MSILGEVTFYLNEPTRNNRVYTKDSFLSFQPKYFLSNTMPHKDSPIERQLTVLPEEQIGEVLNIRIENDKIVGDIIDFTKSLSKYKEPIKLLLVGAAKIFPMKNFNLVKDYRVSYFAIDYISCLKEVDDE